MTRDEHGIATNSKEMSTTLEIHKMLVASTAHLTEAESMDGLSTCNLPVYELDYGWLVYVSTDEFDEGGCSDGLRGVVAVARAEGCAFIRFDCDGSVIDGVPSYEW